MRTDHLGQARVLYAHLIQSGRHRIDEVAARMGVDASTLYAYCEGKIPFPLWRLRSLYAATRDVQLYSDIMGCGDLGLTLSVDPLASDVGAVERQAMEFVGAAGRLTSAVVKALEDKRVDAHEASEVSTAAEAVQREAEELGQAVRLRKAIP